MAPLAQPGYRGGLRSEVPMHLRLFALLALFVPTVASAETVWTTRTVDVLRWPGAAYITFTLTSGQEVEVVVKSDNLVRIRVKDDYGWVPQDALSATEPGAEPSEPPSEEEKPADPAE